MYCPINNSENRGRRCISGCCRLYNFALTFLATLILLIVGLILGATLADALLTALPLLIVSAAILFVVFLVTLITKGCCSGNDTDE